MRIPRNVGYGDVIHVTQRDNIEYICQVILEDKYEMKLIMLYHILDNSGYLTRWEVGSTWHWSYDTDFSLLLSIDKVC